MKILLLISATLVVIFLFIASVAPFKHSLFAGLFPKYSSHAAGNGSINLLPNIIASAGQTFITPIMVDSAGQDVVGVDIMLHFDKTILQLIDTTVYPENSNLKDVIPGELSSGNAISQKSQFLTQANSTGIIQFSAITLGPEKVFNGTLGQANPFAKLQFKLLSNSPTAVTFEHTPGSTIDTNLTGEGAVELLSTVTNLNVNNSAPITYPETSPNPSSKPGDIDGNNKVDIFDYNQLLTDFGKTGPNLIADLDKDSKVGIFDYNILLTNFGK